MRPPGQSSLVRTSHSSGEHTHERALATASDSTTMPTRRSNEALILLPRPARNLDGRIGWAACRSFFLHSRPFALPSSRALPVSLVSIGARLQVVERHGSVHRTLSLSAGTSRRNFGSSICHTRHTTRAFSQAAVFRERSRAAERRSGDEKRNGKTIRRSTFQRSHFAEISRVHSFQFSSSFRFIIFCLN